MGKTLEEYAAQHRQEEPDQERAAAAGSARSYQDQLQDQEAVADLKISIAQQLREGNAPQYILYSAIRAIAILTHDPEWEEAQRRILDLLYGDLAQQSLLMDTAALAAERLDTMRDQYNAKLRRQLTAQISGCSRVEAALKEALQAVKAFQTIGALNVQEEPGSDAP